MTPVQLPEVPAQRDCVAFRWEGDPINEASDAPWKYASHWSTPPWHHRPVECLYTAAQLRAYATDAVMAERARLPNAYAISMALHTVYMDHDDYKVTTTLLDDMAKAVAALLTQPEQNSGR